MPAVAPFPCPFCDLRTRELVAENDLATAFRDGYPVAEGHTLVVPRRHVADFFDCTPQERDAVLALVDAVKADLDQRLHPDGYNLGVNVGRAAGQTVMHVHLHVIPRKIGDVEDPRGGVRFVIPERGNYTVQRAECLMDADRGGDLLTAIVPPLLRASRVDVLAAFVQDSGLQEIEPFVRAALERGARIRVLTGDYLDITQADALRRLADWTAFAEAAAERPDAGSFQARVMETARLAGRSFHPKAWHLEGPDFGVAFVGSSNLSRSALRGGVEWNLRVDRHRDRVAWARVAESFARLWDAARDVDAAWIAAYAARLVSRPSTLPPGEVEAEAAVALPEPSILQREALDALEQTRRENRQRALVVMATGLGKTVLAALDIVAHAPVTQTPSILWIAHRQELLAQAADTLRRGLPDARFGWLLGGRRTEEPFDVLFASVQSLSRPTTLARFAPDRFEYIVVDEVHHAEAPSYRRILAHFTPAFLLGLTATPERADGGDIPGLFDDHVPYRADLGVGITEGLLVPFSYFGLADTSTHYRHAWRNHKWDVDLLSEAVENDLRMEKLWLAWNAPDKAGSRTMVFCVSVRHATWVRDWLQARGVRIRLCHGSPNSDDRNLALQDLENGRIDAICSVDLFNEGIDCRPLDRVVMLRPTESPVLFLQQLGRGLRTFEGKKQLVVVDFVGNHEVFLDRVRTLIQLGGDRMSVPSFLRRPADLVIPPGCEIDFELEALDLLKRLVPQGTPDAFRDAYRELRSVKEGRPLAGEMVRRGFSLGSLGRGRGRWFGFADAEGDLTPSEVDTARRAGPWLDELQTTQMSKCFKMVVLEVLLDAGALLEGLALDDLARRCHALLCRSPELFEDLEGVQALPDPRHPDAETWRAYWRTNPVQAWCNGPWFRVVGDRFVPQLPQADPDVLAALTREIVDARLAAYRRRRAAGGAAVVVKVSWNQRDPILFLPTGADRDRLPTGDVDVQLPDGTPWRFRFVKVAVNVAHPVGRDGNALPDLLREWFGPAAGRPGTDFRVRFRPSPDGWWIEPMGEVIPLAARRGRVIAFPTLKAAAGWDGESLVTPEAEEAVLPGPFHPGEFAVRVSGPSMDGGRTPLRDGDWAVFQWARGMGVAALEGRVAMVGVGDEPSFHIKRIVRDARGFVLRSDNPAFETRPAVGAEPYGRFVRAIRAEHLAPVEGSTVSDLVRTFDLTGLPVSPRGRVDAHLFLTFTGREGIAAPDRIDLRVPDRRPGETAFVLWRPSDEAEWTYLGVGRWLEDEGRWAFPAMSVATWRALSGSRSASRTLPETCLEQAARVASDAVARLADGWVEKGGQRARVIGRAPQGGIRIDGGEGGFRERTVSLLDLGWVLAAQEDVRDKGGILDEARVNRLRYLEGTEKGATRWIDTGWAIAVVRSVAAM